MMELLKITMIYFLFISAYCYCPAQNNVMENFSLESQLLYPEVNTNPLNSFLRYNTNSLYILDSEPNLIEKDAILKIFKLTDNTTEKYFFSMPESDWIYNFAVRNDTLIILGQNKIYFFREHDAQYWFEKDIINSKQYDNMYFDSDKLVLTRCCYCCRNNGSYAGIVDIENNKYILDKKIQDPEGFPLITFTPRRSMSFSNKTFIFSDLTEYNIYLCDTNLNIINKLSRRPEQWKTIDNLDSIFSLVTEFQDVQRFDKYFFEIDKRNSSIILIDFIGSNYIFVCWSGYNEQLNGKKYFYDIWEKKNDAWILVKSDLVNPDRNLDDLFNIDKFSFINNIYRIDNGRLILPSFFPVLLTDFEIDKITFKQVAEKAKLIRQNSQDLKSSFFIYKLNIK